MDLPEFHKFYIIEIIQKLSLFFVMSKVPTAISF